MTASYPNAAVAKTRAYPYPPPVTDPAFPDRIDVAIVGAGAAGLAAGIHAGETAAKTGRSIAIFDGATHLGAKILVSGGGRCNVTHAVVTPTDFFGNRHIIKNVLAAFSVDRTVAWFDSLGVKLKQEETNKLFPVTDKARTVLNALLARCREVNVAIRPDHRVTALERDPDGRFVVHHTHGRVRARTVILATGGRSLPKSGSDGFGYELARKLGHTVTPMAPALVPFVLAPSMFHATLSGLSHDVELTTVVGHSQIDRRTGSLLWTHFGISGPVVMDASRFWTLARARGETADMYGNFFSFSGDSSESARAWVLDRAAEHPRRSIRKVLAERLPDRLAAALCGYLHIDPERAAGQVPRADRDRLCKALTRFRFPIERDRG